MIDPLKLQTMFENRYLLVKRGKRLGRTVLRWAQFTEKGKMLYFTTRNNQQPQGLYSLYQTSISQSIIVVTLEIGKILKKKVGEQVTAIQIYSERLKINVFVIPEDSKDCNMVQAFCELAAKGELFDYLQERQNAFNQENENIQCLGSVSEDDYIISVKNRPSDGLVTNNQKLSQNQSQTSIKFEQTNHILIVDEFHKYNSNASSHRDINSLRQEVIDQYQYRSSPSQEVVPLDPHAHYIPTMEDWQADRESENLEVTANPKKILGTLQCINKGKGVTSKYQRASQLSQPMPSKAPVDYLLTQQTVTQAFNYMRNKANQVSGDNDDDLLFDEEVEEIGEEFNNKIRVEKKPERFYDQDEAVTSLLMEQNPFEGIFTPLNHQQVTEGQLRNQNMSQNLSILDVKNLEEQTEVVISQNPMQALYQGIEMSWNFKLKQAKKIFTTQMHLGDIRHQIHNLELNFFKVLITGKKSLIGKCLEKVRKQEIVMQQIKINKNESLYRDSIDKRIKMAHLDPENLIQNVTPQCLEIISGEVLMFKGVLKFLEGSRFKSLMIFKDSYKIFRKYEQYLGRQEYEIPYWFDCDLRSRVQLGLGLFNLGLAALPKSLAAIIRLVGFSANRERGRELLEQCMRQKRCRSIYATLILCLFHLDQEPNYERVCSYLMNILNVFPHSSLFLWVTTIVSWKYSQLDDAVFFIKRAIDTLPQDLANEASFLKYEIGWFHYLKLEFNLSLPKYKEVLKECLCLEYEINEAETLQLQSMTDRGEQTHRQNQLDLFQSISPKSINRNEGFIYLPHRACLSIQLAGVYVYLQQDAQVRYWLLKTLELAHQPCIARSKLDQEMGHLAYVYLNYKTVSTFLTYEIIYFLQQIPKLPNSILFHIISDITKIIRQLGMSLNTDDPSIYSESPYLSDYVSGMMLTIICYCFLGDQEVATLFSDRLVRATALLPPHYSYLAVHGLYWVGRCYVSVGMKKEAESALMKAKKYKKYEFDISVKLDRVLADLKK